MKYLFGAEVNRIQQTLFRVSKLRQVVGGSTLLTAFGEKAAELATERFGVPEGDVLVASGGTFRIMFPDQARAVAFGLALEAAYAEVLDGTLTIAPPVAVNGDGASFKAANEALSRDLNERKRRPRALRSSAHSPTTAFCHYSGVGLAEHSAALTNKENEQYRSGFAQRMTEAGVTARNVWSQDSFLGRLSRRLRSDLHQWDWPSQPEDLKKLDGKRGNIAYLVADGNNMGRLFGACETAPELRSLSEALDGVIFQAIAEALDELVAHLKLPKQEIPAIPLIVAGDDVFMVLPAPQALSFARLFCLNFERLMMKQAVVTSMLHRLSLAAKSAGSGAQPFGAKPTMSAAVVICKSNYPYQLAHHRGEEVLSRVKRTVKSVGFESKGEWRSAVSYSFLAGSELIGGDEPGGEYRAGLKVYWAVAENESGLGERARAAALNLNALFDCCDRMDKKEFPSKRLSELRALYAPEFLPISEKDLDERWTPAFKRYVKRIRQTQSEGVVTALMHALETLGDERNSQNPGAWKHIERHGEKWQAHGLPDLIALRLYAQKLPEP